MSNKFKDYFSQGAADYSRYRPKYPKSLFTYLASIAPSQLTAWDCATGSGQSASVLSKYFEQVIATDASHKQIENAISNRGVTYKVECAEKSSIKSSSIDLITVAQALHWFNLNEFAAEVERVLVVKGILAAWTYGLFKITPELDTIISHLYGPVLNQYWPPERKMIEAGYQDIRFPLKQIEAPVFDMETEWTLSQLLGYLRTWSAVKKCEYEEGVNPVETLHQDFVNAWGNSEKEKLVRWPLNLKLWANE